MNIDSPAGPSPAWTSAGWTMIHLAWLGLVIGLIATSGRRLLKRATPEARYGFALACLTAFGVAPFALFAFFHEPEVARIANDGVSRRMGVRFSSVSAPDVLAPFRSRLPASASASVPPSRAAIRPRFDAWVARLPWFWLAGSAASVIAMGTGLVGVERLRRSSRPAEEAGEVARACRAMAGSLGIARRVGVAACDHLASPVLIGIVRPLILLPTAAFGVWSPEEVEMALLHELAHLRRWDNLANLLQRGVESLLFFHPVAWWLSAWVRLERESCCDRVVVARTGRPCRYAGMLASLAGSGREFGGRRAALGMADRQVTTRIRRILNMEDRPMRMTLPEGCGLLGASTIALALAFGGAQAAPPSGAAKAEDAARLALRGAADEVAVVDLRGESSKPRTLNGIARAQLKLDDRASALVTLDRASDGIDRLDFRGDHADRIHDVIETADLRDQAGDPASARETLDRVTALIDRIPVDPAAKPKVTGGEIGERRIEEETGAMIRLQLLATVAGQRAKLGDLETARALFARLVPFIRTLDEPLRSLFLSGIAAERSRAGDPAGARAMIDEAKASASAIVKPVERARALCYVAQALGEIGDLPAAIALAQSLREVKYETKALEMIADGYTEHDPGDPTTWLDSGGIKFLIGSVGRKSRDRDASRRDLPGLAEAVGRSAGTGPARARILSRIAHLQAMAGDIAGARATAEAIPEVRRADFPGPADGFYDAVKPGTLAIVAALADKAGERAASGAMFRLATEITRSIGADDQSLFARLILARELSGTGRDEDALVLLREAAPVALRQPEPLRSRSLAMIAAGQSRAGNLAGASATAGSIRDYPGLEKHRALTGLADAFEKAGDPEAARRALREALRCVEAKAPENPPMGPKSNPLRAISQASFIDPDLELGPPFVEFHKQSLPAELRARLGDLDGAVRVARALPEGRRDFVLSALVSQLARGGDIPKALELAATITKPEGRLAAIEQAAFAVRSASE